MSLILHWIHLLAAIAWIGGITYVVLVLFPVLPAADPVARATLAPRLMRRFLTIVWLSAGLLMATGLYRVLAVQRMTTESWFHTGYGHSLMTKLGLSFLLLGIAGHLTAVTYPRVRAHMQEHLASPAPMPCATCARLMGSAKRMMRIGWAIGVIVILLAARLRGA